MDSCQRNVVSGKSGEGTRAMKSPRYAAILFIFLFLGMLLLYRSNPRAVGTLGLTGYLFIIGVYVAVMKILEESSIERLHPGDRAGLGAKDEEDVREILHMAPDGNLPIHGLGTGRIYSSDIPVSLNGRELDQETPEQASDPSSGQGKPCPDGESPDPNQNR